ncbi:GNAT family N-acetyltransferase [Shewanella maritima]|uniref:GNAT family N-acetyltransferase n=1 Tax=Shewanella maritima TaxID=2520507 RepID=UPI0037356C9C
MQWQTKWVDSITSIGSSNWQQLFDSTNPFIQFAYLHGLEHSGVVSEQTGWQPKHLVVFKGQQIVAALPVYLKQHSWGEYVFDWAWAEAYERNQLAYYPKLVTSIPFTPVSGPRLGLHNSLSEVEKQSVCRLILDELINESQRRQYSSWHGLFLPITDQVNFDHSDTFTRIGTQFHWHNNNYQDFDDFLAKLLSRKRKMIKKERQVVLQQGFQFQWLQGHEINSMWHKFYACYQQTYLKRSGHTGYLNLAFFEHLGQHMLACIRLLHVTDRHNETVAMALYFVGENKLFGRYWGTFREADGLHFEACYYQGIEYAIKHGLSVFDAGAQGEHKVSRGFIPVKTRSRHYIVEPQFADAIKAYCQQEEQHMGLYMQQMLDLSPYKQ